MVCTKRIAAENRGRNKSRNSDYQKRYRQEKVEYHKKYQREYAKRNKCDNRFYELDGRYYNMNELSLMSGVKYSTLRARINDYGWTVKSATELE